MKTWQKAGLIAVGAIAALLLVLVLVFTQTRFGRERVRLFGLGQLQRGVHGVVDVARVEGNLLSGMTLIGVAITDSAGNLFLRADTVSLRYSLRSLFRKHLNFHDVRLVRPVIVLDRQPGQRWNFERLFRGDSMVVPGDTIPGFGDWVLFEDLEVVAGDITVRNAWLPDPGLRGTARAAAIRHALSPEYRQRIVPVPGGFQAVSTFRQVNGSFPLFRLADPDSALRVVRIARLDMIALPFRPPAAQVRDARGQVAFGEDTVFLRALHLRLPATQLRVDGWYSTKSGDTNVRVRGPSVSFPDLRFALPQLPDGGGKLKLAYARVGGAQRVVASDMDVRAEGARLAGQLDIETGRAVRLGPSDLRYWSLDTRLLERVLPALQVPVDGVLTGHMRLAGVAEELSVDGWTTIRDRAGATSRIEADGTLGNRAAGVYARDLALRFDPLRVSLVERLGGHLPVGGTLTGRATLDGLLSSRFSVDADLVHANAGTGRSRVLATGQLAVQGGVSARDLRLRFDPLQVALVRRFDPGLPLDGTITGNATLNGAPASGLAADLSLRHQGNTGTSVFAGEVNVTFREVLQRINADLRVEPFALATAGLFAPAAGLRGTASGRVTARGNRQLIAFTTDLSVAGGGDIAARGTLSPGRNLRYDVVSRLASFDPAAVSSRAPAGRLSGAITAVGSGTSAATASAVIDARLVDSHIPGAPQLDSTVVRAKLANGLATFEQGHVSLASINADVQGSFGLVAGRTGELRYVLTIDSLAQVPGLPAGDSGVVQPRPIVNLRRVAVARADSAAFALETEVERAATGQPSVRPARADTMPAIPRDSIAGSLRAEGVLAGNVQRFTATGTASLEDLVFQGNAVRTGRIEYELARAPEQPLGASVNAQLGGVHAGGFQFDSAQARLEHRGGFREGEGTVDVAVFQDPDRDYRLSSAFTLALDRKELRISNATLRFDTTVWRSAHPSRVSWAAAGFELDQIELRTDRGGRLFADGRIPTSDGSGNLRLELDSLQVADVAALLQDTAETRGLLSLDAQVQGTARAPRIAGELALDSASRSGQAIPALRSTFKYAAQELAAEVKMVRDSVRLLAADVALPVDLALSGRQGPLLLRDRPLRVDARADSLPLEALPAFTTAVRDLRGTVAGDIAVRGTLDAATVSGQLRLERGSLRLAAPGFTLENATASIRLAGDRATVDSLVARSGGGLVRASGTLDLAQLTRPGFDLTVTADNAVLLDNEHGRVRADAELAIAGPFERVRVTGDVEVQRGVIHVPDPANARRATNLDDPTLVSALDTLGVGVELRRLPPPILRNLQVDVGIRVARDTWVRSPTANVEIYTPDDGRPVRLTVDNARQALVLEGTINADRGEYSVAGRQFELTTGSVTFLGDPVPDPLLQLSAQYQVSRRNREALIILINIGGYLSEPRISLSSNAEPPLPESDLISYLAFGRSSSSLIDQGGSGITGSELGVLAEQQLAGLGLGAFVDASVAGLEEQGAQAGLDVFRVRPAPLPDELSFGGYFRNLLSGMELQAGKYITPRFFLSAQGRTSGAPPGLRLEWQEPGGWSWYATWEPGYLPQEPSLSDTQARRTRIFGSFLRWTRRF